jgi:hypothetical protein
VRRFAAQLVGYQPRSAVVPAHPRRHGGRRRDPQRHPVPPRLRRGPLRGVAVKGEQQETMKNIRVTAGQK